MNSGSRSPLVDALAGLFSWAIVAMMISKAAHIRFIFALAIMAVTVVCGICLVMGATSAWQLWKRCKPCKHGIYAGLGGRCRACLAEATRIKQEGEARVLEWEQHKSVERQAKELFGKERDRLRRAWLTNAEAYLQMNPKQFEDAIAEIFRKLGYEVRQTPFTNDGGKDAVAFKNGKTYLIECKRYDATTRIGRRDLQVFVAAMQDEKANAGFYVNTGSFTKNAKEYAARNRIVIYDRFRLPHLVNKAYPIPADISTASVMCRKCGAIMAMPVGDDPTTGTCANGHSLTNNITRAHLRIVTPTGVPLCDRCGCPMRIVNGYRGKFWGCTEYPRCRGTKPFNPRAGTPTGA